MVPQEAMARPLQLALEPCGSSACSSRHGQQWMSCWSAPEALASNQSRLKQSNLAFKV